MLRILAECEEIRRRESHKSRILARLREGPATGSDLAQITHRFGARILELRRDGARIFTDYNPATGESTYWIARDGELL